MVLFFFVRDRFLLSSWDIFPKHINGWGTSNMINGAVHVLCLAKVYKLNIWTLAWFNEQYFSDISPKLYSVGDLSFFVVALCCLLIGPHRTKKKISKTTCMRIYTNACANTHYHHWGGPFLPAQEGMMTLIIASKQEGHSAPTQQPY